MNQLTTKQMAARVGVKPRRLLQIASSRGVRPVYRVGRAWLWDKDQASELRPRPVGRPRKDEEK